MAVQKITVKVTPIHIKNARPKTWRRNPVALALRDAGFRFVEIGSFTKSAAFISKSSRGLVAYNWTILDLPKKVTNFLKRYVRLVESSPKKRTKLKPLSFVVKLTPELEEVFSAVRHIEGAPRRFDEEVEIELKRAA